MVVYYTLRIDIMTLYAYFQGLFLLEEEDIPLMSRRNFVTDKFFSYLCRCKTIRLCLGPLDQMDTL